MKATLESIRRVIETELPGEVAHAHLMPVNRPFSSALKESALDYRRSAVAIVVYEAEGELMSILIQRPEYDGVHSRQIAFPGGKMDASDPDLEFTAKRECMEEIAIPIHHLQLVGALTDIYIPVSKFIVSPFIFHVAELPELIPDAREVAGILPFPLKELMVPNAIRTTSIQFNTGFTQKNVPYFDIQNQIVWGATGMILSELRAVLERI